MSGKVAFADCRQIAAARRTLEELDELPGSNPVWGKSLHDVIHSSELREGPLRGAALFLSPHAGAVTFSLPTLSNARDRRPVKPMKKTFSFLATTLIAAAFSTAISLADDWPQWRGPNRDGISTEKGLLKQWPASGPKLLWQVGEIGSGYSTPSIVGDRVYLMGNEGTAEEFIAALDTKNGKRIWSTRVGNVGPNDPNMNFPGARSTPTIDGDALYALGSDGDLFCASTKDGKIRWQKNLRSEFGGKPGRWAYSESVLVDGDLVVCTPGGSEATIVALNKKDGKLVWKCAASEADEAAYSSIIALDAGGKKQYVQFLQKGLVGVDSKTGKLLWRYEQTAKGSPANIPTPVASEGMIYSATGRGGGGLVKLVSASGEVKAEQVYFQTKLPNAIGGGVKVGDYLYGSAGASLMCVEFKTGQQKWEDRSIGASSILFADGHLYLHGENGEVALVEASVDGYKEKGRFAPPAQPDRGGRIKAWAYPALSNGRLYIRDLTQLWCYDVKE